MQLHLPHLPHSLMTAVTNRQVKKHSILKYAWMVIGVDTVRLAKDLCVKIQGKEKCYCKCEVHPCKSLTPTHQH